MNWESIADIPLESWLVATPIAIAYVGFWWGLQEWLLRRRR